MSLINKFGKASCVFGILAFTLGSSAKYSQLHHTLDREQPLLSILINAILNPSSYLLRFNPPESQAEPVIKNIDVFHVFEAEAILIFLIACLISCLISIWLGFRAAKNHEESLWYSAGILFTSSALIMINIYLGILLALLLMVIIHQMRRKA